MDEYNYKVFWENGMFLGYGRMDGEVEYLWKEDLI